MVDPEMPPGGDEDNHQPQGVDNQAYGPGAPHVLLLKARTVFGSQQVIDDWIEEKNPSDEKRAKYTHLDVVLGVMNNQDPQHSTAVLHHCTFHSTGKNRLPEVCAAAHDNGKNVVVGPKGPHCNGVNNLCLVNCKTSGRIVIDKKMLMKLAVENTIDLPVSSSSIDLFAF